MLLKEECILQVLGLREDVKIWHNRDEMTIHPASHLELRGKPGCTELQSIEAEKT